VKTVFFLFNQSINDDMVRRGLIFLLVVVSCTFFNSCQFKRPPLTNTWFYSHNAKTETSTQNPVKLTPENFIDLQPDGSFTSDIAEFEYGSWKGEGDYIQLQNQNGEQKIFTIISYHDGELTLDLTPNVKNDYNRVFTAISNKKSTGKNNPFAKENNRWRIRPSSPETDGDIKDRLVNHFKFWETYFEWAVANNFQQLDVRSPNSLLKLYGNGFKLLPYDELSEEWKSNFFNEEDCHKAWDKLKKLVDSKDIAWPKTENRFKFFVSAFQQLQEMVE
jgi:hypothetical protein